MRMDELDGQTIERIVSSLPSSFDTHHVIADPRFATAHHAYRNETALHSLTGRHLRKNASTLGITYEGQRGRSTVALWNKAAEPRRA